MPAIPWVGGPSSISQNHTRIHRDSPQAKLLDTDSCWQYEETRHGRAHLLHSVFHSTVNVFPRIPLVRGLSAAKTFAVGAVGAKSTVRLGSTRVDYIVSRAGTAIANVFDATNPVPAVVINETGNRCRCTWKLLRSW